MAWILHDVFLARPPADCERRLKRRLANPATGCVACRERIYVFVTMLKVALRNVRLAPKTTSQLSSAATFVVPRGREPTRGTIICRASDRPELDRRRRHVGVSRIIDVASPVAAIERRTVVAGQRQVASQPFGQITLGDEVAAEGDEGGGARRDDWRGTLIGGNTRLAQCAAGFLPQMLGCDRRPAL